MGTLEKLVKSFETLKLLQLSPTVSQETSLRRKEKIGHCLAIADALCHSTVKGAPNFSHLLSIAIEILLQLCDDPHVDVRMMADESLNRVIRAMADSNVVKIQVELHKEIKKNGSARPLRAALWRFAELCHLIRAQKGKPYAMNLIPCLIHIARRKEEPVLETLAAAMPKIFRVLGNFTSDNDIKGLLKAFLQNLSSDSAVVRRAASASIVTVCLNCRKPPVFTSYVANTLLDSVIPIQPGQSVCAVLGVLGCLRNIIPHMSMGGVGEEEMRGSFGVRRCQQETQSAVDRMIQVYELCLHYTNHTDHNVVNAALETLHQLLQSPSPDLVPVLLSSKGVTRSRIQAEEGQEKLALRSLSQMSVAQSLAVGDETALLDPDPELGDLKLPAIESWVAETKAAFREGSTSSTDKQNSEPDESENVERDEFDFYDVEEVALDLQVPDSEDLRYQTATKQSSQSDELQDTCPSPSSVASHGNAVPYQACDVGTFTDADVPLKFCCRHLARSFLLTGCADCTMPDRSVRVSVKALALSCLASAVRLSPNMIFLPLDKAATSVQTVCDVLLFATHPDPQLRGITSTVIGNLLESALTVSGGNFTSWRAAEVGEASQSSVAISHLLTLLMKGLEDESSVCVCQTLTALSVCLPDLLESVDSQASQAILAALPLVASNSYWLVKVKLVELVCELSYVTIHHIKGSSEFQDQVIQSVLFVLLRDEDARVRQATAKAIVKIVGKLFFMLDQPHQDAATVKGACYSEQLLSEMVVSNIDSGSYSLLQQININCLPAPFSMSCPHNRHTAAAVSRMVNLLSQSLLMSASKYLTLGCCETLAHLSAQYYTTVYSRAWNMSVTSSKKSTSRPKCGASETCSGLLCTALSMLTASPVSLDLSCQQWLIQLSGNLLSGLAVQYIYLTDYNAAADDAPKQLWAVLKDKQLCSCAELLLLHVLRILNIFVHIVDEVSPSVPTLKPSLPSLPSAPSLSPMKRKAGTTTATDSGRTKGMSPAKSSSDKEERSTEDKKSARGALMGTFSNISHYMRIYDIVKNAYTNYKITLDSSASEKFVSLLRVTLETLSQLLEIGTLHETGRIAEEVLSYLRCTVTVEPTATVKCVQQLLKSLFGTNVSSQSEEYDEHHFASSVSVDGFYSACFQTPYRQFTDFVTSSSSKLHNKDYVQTWMGNLRRKTERKMSSFKGFTRGADKTSLAAYIRLFEPMVIKALKQYTVTSDVQLQCRVLLLLSQLVQLRVNYCLLDSDQIFIGFVLKQFEFIEEGQILHAEELIPRIFYFLVHLSYEKHHSKCIIGIPKIIQLCDGLMASGQSPITHCIPALVPIVEDVFLVRGSSSTSSVDLKELDTQREVLISMLLRLVEHHQVLELLSVVLNECRDNEERWRRWSLQVVDTLFPLLSQGRVRLESRAAQHSLQRVLSSVSPGVLRPVDSLLSVLFSETPQLDSSTLAVERWLGMVLAVLLTLISQGKEEVVLARLEELAPSLPLSRILHAPSEKCDPLNATTTVSKLNQLPPEHIMARFLLQVVGLVSSHIHTALHSTLTKDSCKYLQEQLSHFLLYCIYMFESGSYCRVATAVIRMLQSNSDAIDTFLSVEDMNTLLLALAPKCPLLTFEWCYLLTLINYSNQTFWAKVLCTESRDFILKQTSVERQCSGPSPCINMEVVRKGGIILFCDYVSENMNNAEQLTCLLVNHIEEIVTLSTEPPVQELIAAVHRNPAASGLLVQAVAARCHKFRQPGFVCRVLRCLEGVHPSQSGALLMLLIPRLLGYPQLAPARLAGTLACRRTELLLTLPPAEVMAQLSEADLKKLVDVLDSSSLSKRHNTLVSLLNKVGAQCYNITPVESNPANTFNPNDIHSISIDKTWFLAQVTARCSQLGLETAQLISKLDYEEIVTILNCKEFNSLNIMYCFKLGTQLTLQNVCAQGQQPVLESPLYRASRESLLQQVANIRALMPKPHQVYYPQGREMNVKEAKYSCHLDQLFADRSFCRALFRAAPALTCYLQSLSVLSRGGAPQNVPQESWDDISKFGILCLEAVHWLLRTQHSKPWYLHVGLCSADEILREPNISSVVGQSNHASWVASGASSITAIIKFLLGPLPFLPETGLGAALTDPDRMCAAHACHQMAVLVMWMQKTMFKTSSAPKFLIRPVKSLIVSLSRLPLVNSYVATPPDVWRQGWAAELSGPSHTLVPALPVDYLQDIDILQQLIFRITHLGWTSRQQFEETWMAFLSVLNSNPLEHCAPEDMAVMVHASSLAVQAITALLIQTLMMPIPGNPNCSHLVHQPREKSLSQTNEKLRAIQELFCWRLLDQQLGGQTLEPQHVFKRRSIERILSSDRYGYSQVSLEYLWTATRLLDGNSSAQEEMKKATVSASCLEHEQCLATSGLDLHSCLHFLLDLYSQWTLPQSGTPLQLISEAMRSVLAISDLFTEKAQLQWMLSTCLELGKHHPVEDEILHQYLVLGACKAAAVLGPEPGVFERVCKMVESSLKSSYLPARIAGLHGVLYLLQATSTRITSHHIQSATSEEMFHIQPLAVDYLQKHIDVTSSGSEEHQLIMWGLVFFLLENMEEKMADTEVAPSVLQLALNLVTAYNLSPSIHLALLQGLERLVVTGSVGGKVAEQVTKIAVERLKHPSPAIATPALQLLLSCMYTERCEGGKPDGKESDPELLIQSMERTSALFDRIKKGYPFEVELVCGVLPNLLNDFFPPSEIMTKVIGEFLSTQQPHPRLLAAVVFQIFECACQQSQLPLLQDWVVLSVANFTQCSPVGIASWCLTCFFISASTNQWLRALFPHVQTRIGRCESEDRRLLYIAAVDFYHQLRDKEQKLKFQSAFQTAAGQPLFAELVSCLQVVQ